MTAKKAQGIQFSYSNTGRKLLLPVIVTTLLFSPTSQAQESKEGFNPMNFTEFWKPQDPSQQLSKKVSSATTTSVAQGIIYSAMQDDPTHIKEIAGASMQGATTVEIVGTVINTVLEQAAISKEESLPLCVTMYKNTTDALKPNAFAQIMRNFAVSDQKTVLLTMLPVVEPNHLTSVVASALSVVEWESFKEAAQEIYNQMKTEGKIQFKQAINLGIQKFRETPQTQN